MAQLALVSRNPVMSMGLSALDHDIVEVRPHNLDDWLDAGNDAGVNALVLDLGSPTRALQLVGDLRANGRWTPVLLVASSDDGWDTPELLGLPGVDILHLPLDSTRLKAATESVLRHPNAPPVHREFSANGPVPTPEPQAPPQPLIEEIEVPFVVPEPTFLATEPETEEGEHYEPPPTKPEPSPAPQPPPTVREPQRATPSPPPPPPVVEVAEQPSPEAVPTSEVAPVWTQPIPVREVAPEPEPSKKPERTKRLHRAPHSAKSTVAPTAPEPTRVPLPSGQTPRRRATDRLGEQAPPELVATLLGLADGLYTLTETAQVIVEDAVSRAAADSGTLLVPDGEYWRVAAGVGLRPLEYRYQLTEDSWLVTSVGSSKKGVLVEDSDVARQQLHGAPLASRTHLLAVPVAAADAILLMSRDHDPAFDELVLADLAHLADEAGALLQRAVDVRSLARSLARHLDPTELPRD